VAAREQYSVGAMRKVSNPNRAERRSRNGTPHAKISRYAIFAVAALKDVCDRLIDQDLSHFSKLEPSLRFRVGGECEL